MKILHLSFHRGACESVASLLPGVTTKLLPIGEGGYTYNITHELADQIWSRDKDYFNSFDCVITTDTALLSRIFLQNGFSKRLIIWVCNRFDYWDGGGVPDKEYYDLMVSAMSMPNVSIIGYTPFEQVYCAEKGVYVEDVVHLASIPQNHNTDRTRYYIPDYQNNYTFDLAMGCSSLPLMTGRHGGSDDMKTFKAIIHLPYHWCGVAEYQALSLGVPYYVPTKRLFFELLRDKRGYWFQNMNYCEKFIDICDFYDKRNLRFMYYFDDINNIQDIKIDYDDIFDVAWNVYGENKTKLIKLIYGN